MAEPNYHPDVRLRLHQLGLTLAYDGSVYAASYCELIGRDGTPLAQRHTYAHRLEPNAWHGYTLPALTAEAFRAHHDWLSLNPPADDDVPLHLHPQGHPGLADNHPVPPPPDPGPPPDPRTLRQYVDDVARRTRP